jgi:hypothetical protein
MDSGNSESIAAPDERSIVGVLLQLVEASVEAGRESVPTVGQEDLETRGLVGEAKGSRRVRKSSDGAVRGFSWIHSGVSGGGSSEARARHAGMSLPKKTQRRKDPQKAHLQMEYIAIAMNRRTKRRSSVTWRGMLWMGALKKRTSAIRGWKA